MREQLSAARLQYRAVELAARAHYALQSRAFGATVRAYTAAASLHGIDARA